MMNTKQQSVTGGRIAARKCPSCGESFTPSKASNVYCDIDCYAAANPPKEELKTITIKISAQDYADLMKHESGPFAKSGTMLVGVRSLLAQRDDLAGQNVRRAAEYKVLQGKLDEARRALKLVRMISNGIGAADLLTGQSETVLLAPKTLEQIDAAIANA